MVRVISCLPAYLSQRALFGQVALGLGSASTLHFPQRGVIDNASTAIRSYRTYCCNIRVASNIKMESSGMLGQ